MAFSDLTADDQMKNEEPTNQKSLGLVHTFLYTPHFPHVSGTIVTSLNDITIVCSFT